MKGFIILNKMKMKNGVKYEIGKRYYVNNKTIIYHKLDLYTQELNLNSELKIYEVSIDKLDSFKIIKEIDYKSFITQNKINIKNFNKISILKLQDEQTIKYLIINKEERYFKDILQTNNRKYIDYLINNEEQFELTLYLFFKYNLTNNNLKKLSFSKTWENQYVVADVGRPIDLDTLQKTTNDREIIGAILRNGRKKDLEKMKNSIFNQDLIKDFTDDDILNLR